MEPTLKLHPEHKCNELLCVHTGKKGMHFFLESRGKGPRSLLGLTLQDSLELNSWGEHLPAQMRDSHSNSCMQDKSERMGHFHQLCVWVRFPCESRGQTRTPTPIK